MGCPWAGFCRRTISTHAFVHVSFFCASLASSGREGAWEAASPKAAGRGWVGLPPRDEHHRTEGGGNLFCPEYQPGVLVLALSARRPKPSMVFVHSGGIG